MAYETSNNTSREETCSRQTCTPTPTINQRVKFNTLTSKILSVWLNRFHIIWLKTFLSDSNWGILFISNVHTNPRCKGINLTSYKNYIPNSEANLLEEWFEFEKTKPIHKKWNVKELRVTPPPFHVLLPLPMSFPICKTAPNYFCHQQILEAWDLEAEKHQIYV